MNPTVQRMRDELLAKRAQAPESAGIFGQAPSAPAAPQESAYIKEARQAAMAVEVFANPYAGTLKGRALELLRKNIGPSEAARVLEITPAAISQYLEDPQFRELVQDGLSIASMARVMRDRKIDELEDMALGQLEKLLPWITKPMEALKAAQVLNGMHRRSTTGEVSLQDAEKVVPLELPKYVQNVNVNLVFNTNNEVVEVNGRELRSMSAAEVQKLATPAGKELEHDSSTSEAT